MASSNTIFLDDDVQNAGEILARAANDIANYLNNKDSVTRASIVHGDFKSANMFFPKKQECGIKVIDYQWSGPGNIMTDMIYLIAMGLSPPSSDNELKNKLLMPYLEHLLKYDPDLKDIITLEQLEIDFSYSLLDFMRWCVTARNLDKDDIAKYQKRKQDMDLNQGRWRRDIELIAWLFKETSIRLKQLNFK